MKIHVPHNIIHAVKTYVYVYKILLLTQQHYAFHPSYLDVRTFLGIYFVENSYIEDYNATV